jgi:hypothetical protein
MKPGSEPKVTDMAEDRLDFDDIAIGGTFHCKALGDKIILYKVELREISIVTTLSEVERRLTAKKVNDFTYYKKAEDPDAEKG